MKIVERIEVLSTFSESMFEDKRREFVLKLRLELRSYSNDDIENKALKFE
jgi:hypothetical protein